MQVGDVGERAVVELLRAQVGAGRRTLLGIGDDAAVLPGGGKRVLVWTTDSMIEGVHFECALASASDVGWKLLASNLSDIAAMGALPTAALVTLGLPPTVTVEWVSSLYEGLLELAGAWNVELVGGDTVGAPVIMLTLALLGEAPEGQVKRRSGARSGDTLYVTGSLGDAAAGLKSLRLGEDGLPEDVRRALRQRHLRPRPRVAEGQLLGNRTEVTAMIDVSDGLAMDLNRLATESGVGARIAEDALPVSDALQRAAHRWRVSPVPWVLSGGEDYELLCAVRNGDRIVESLLGPRVHRIGQVTAADRGIRLLSAGGRERTLEADGYEHFTRPGS